MKKKTRLIKTFFSKLFRNAVVSSQKKLIKIKKKKLNDVFNKKKNQKERQTKSKNLHHL